MFRSKVLNQKVVSGFALMASVPALVSYACGSAGSDAGNLMDNTKALVFNQKKWLR